jgi:hypothetical protein
MVKNHPITSQNRTFLNLANTTEILDLLDYFAPTR